MVLKTNSSACLWRSARQCPKQSLTVNRTLSQSGPQGTRPSSDFLCWVRFLVPCCRLAFKEWQLGMYEPACWSFSNQSCEQLNNFACCNVVPPVPSLCITVGYSERLWQLFWGRGSLTVSWSTSQHINAVNVGEGSGAVLRRGSWLRRSKRCYNAFKSLIARAQVWQQVSWA